MAKYDEKKNQLNDNIMGILEMKNQKERGKIRKVGKSWVMHL